MEGHKLREFTSIPGRSQAIKDSCAWPSYCAILAVGYAKYFHSHSIDKSNRCTAGNSNASIHGGQVGNLNEWGGAYRNVLT